MLRALFIPAFCICLILLVSCAEITSPTLQQQSASDYFIAGKVGTMYTYSVLVKVGLDSAPEEYHKKAFYTIIDRDVPLPDNERGIAVEQRTPYATSDNYLIDTAYYSIVGNTIKHYSRKNGTDTVEQKSVVSFPLRTGDSVSFAPWCTENHSHKVKNNNEQLTVPSGTYSAIHLSREVEMDGGSSLEKTQNSIYYARGVFMVKIYTHHTTYIKAKNTAFVEHYEYQLESVR